MRINSRRLLYRLFPKLNGWGFVVHLFDDGEGFQVVAFFTKYATAILVALFYGDTNACYCGTCLAGDVDKGVNSFAFGKEIIYYQQMVRSRE